MPFVRSIPGALAAALLFSFSIGPSAHAKSPPKSRLEKRAATRGKSKRWVQRNDQPATGKLTRGSTHGSINEQVTLTPFPSQASATRRALAQNRRDRLDDAERAARATTLDDRWSTVLFHLRDLDSRSDPEGCFWRLVAYYRLGQIERARQVRETCELPSRDQAMLEAEEAEATALQSSLALAERDHPPAPVSNPSAYAGAAPTRAER